jgi:coatomer subunit beta
MFILILALLLNGDFYLGSVLSTSLTKLVSRYNGDATKANELKAEAMLIMTSIIRIGKSDFPTSKIDEDSHDRILMCLRVLSGGGGGDTEFMKNVFLVDCRKAYKQLVDADQVCKI